MLLGLLEQIHPYIHFMLLGLQEQISSIDTTIITIKIAFKGAVGDFYNLLTASRTDSSTYAQVARVQSCANHF